ncbi:curli-like amyloid fiber formation chaperone CsgH [Solirhodobacter olei]|uniref:curli-like amyloid fiber formation chaperone CsgH n=1 Tax=Solirhodobacter olei TaxID=2493082 RepID=UPI000FD97CAF|nr:curli-like amyloid fiber formation chaperone CsgH [Solirhodobacter olei]
MASIQCEIRSRPVSSGTELTGVVWAPEGAQGNYRFSVASRGSGGTSNIVQSGFFVLQPHQPKIVGSVVVNSGSGSSFAAHLSVQAEDGGMCGAKA